MDNTAIEALRLAYEDDEKRFNDRVYLLGLHNDTAVSKNVPLRKNLFASLKKKKLKDDVNYYISANTLYSHATRRCESNIFGLKNIVLDIDFHGDPDVELHIETLCNIIYDEMEEAGIPIPNIEHITGRGVHFWWCMNEESRELIFLYRIVAAKLCEKINDILDDYSFSLDDAKVDACASGNPSGVYRLFGTVNTETHMETTCRIINYKRYSLNELKELLGIVYRPVEKKNPVIFHDNIHSVRADAIARLIRERRRNYRDELRDLHIFHYYNEAFQADGPDLARQAVYELNDYFLVPLTSRQLESIMTTIERKGGYRYKNATIIAHLQMEPEEQEEFGLFPGNGGDKNYCRRMRNRLKKETRDELIRKVYAEGHTQAETARICKCCIKTVRKVVKDAATVIKDYTTSILHKCKKIVKKIKSASFFVVQKTDKKRLYFFSETNGHFLKTIYYMRGIRVPPHAGREHMAT